MKTKQSNLINGLLFGVALLFASSATAGVKESNSQSESADLRVTPVSGPAEFAAGGELDILLEQLVPSREVLRESLRAWVDEKEAAQSRQHAVLTAPLVTLARN